MARCKDVLAVAVATLALPLACGCSATSPQPINPEVRIQSTSPDDLPPTGTSGLGTPGGQEDAGLPTLLPDAAAPRPR
jgi:hypothetical protein